MRTSRVSKDTSRLFSRATPSLPQRVTRSSSLAHFSYAADTTPKTTDIEDAVPPPAKRRRRASSGASETDNIKDELTQEEKLVTETKKSPRRARKPARRTVDPDTGEKSIQPPSDWEAVYDGVKKMRAVGGRAYPAAVDTMGCERLADTQASARDQRFHTLVALMLSSQTKDTVNAVAMKRLKTELPPHEEGAPPGLYLENMLAVDPKLLNELIWAVGFHNNKTKFLKQTAALLKSNWNSDIPNSIEGLTSLPGVGPKMAYLCMSAAWDRTEGIGVDVHVHRITNLWGWHSTKNPEGTRLALQSWLPRERWRDINHMLVGLGQTVCLPVGRRCGECELGLGGLCKAAERKKVLQGRKLLETKVEVTREDEGDALVKTEETTAVQEVKIKEEVVNEET